MHWSIAICFLLLLLTIFLRLTWMEKNHVADIMQAYLAEKDVELSREELILLAKKIRKPMWDWHIYLGYVLVGLYSLRMVLPLFGEMKFANPLQKGISGFTKFKYYLYLIFYVFVGISLTTGLLIEFGPKEYKKSVEEIHELSIYYLLTFITLHLGGVFYAEFSNQKGIISRIISGKSKNES